MGAAVRLRTPRLSAIARAEQMGHIYCLAAAGIGAATLAWATRRD